MSLGRLSLFEQLFLLCSTHRPFCESRRNGKEELPIIAVLSVRKKLIS